MQWNTDDIIPPYLVAGTEPLNVNVDVQVFLEETDQIWRPLAGLRRRNVPNDGLEEITISPQMINCRSELFANSLCPIAIKVSVTAGTSITTTEGQTIILRGRVGIWSGVAFLQREGVSESMFSTACDVWANPGASGAGGMPDVIWSRLIPCPPVLNQARLDTRFELEEMESLFGSITTSYPRESMMFFHPNIRECYRQRNPERNRFT